MGALGLEFTCNEKHLKTAWAWPAAAAKTRIFQTPPRSVPANNFHNHLTVSRLENEGGVDGGERPLSMAIKFIEERSKRAHLKCRCRQTRGPDPLCPFRRSPKPHTRLNKVASSTCSWCYRCSWPNTSVRSRGGLATRESVDQETRKWHRASAPPSSLARSLKKFKALETLWQLSSRAANGRPPGFIKLTTFVRQRPGQ